MSCDNLTSDLRTETPGSVVAGQPVANVESTNTFTEFRLAFNDALERVNSITQYNGSVALNNLTPVNYVISNYLRSNEVTAGSTSSNVVGHTTVSSPKLKVFGNAFFESNNVTFFNQTGNAKVYIEADTYLCGNTFVKGDEITNIHDDVLADALFLG